MRKIEETVEDKLPLLVWESHARLDGEILTFSEEKAIIRESYAETVEPLSDSIGQDCFPDFDTILDDLDAPVHDNWPYKKNDQSNLVNGATSVSSKAHLADLDWQEEEISAPWLNTYSFT